MSRVAAFLLLALGLAACGFIDTMVDGMKHVNAIAAELEGSVGMKPKVSFNWHNGRLDSVTVTFPRLYTGKPLIELAEIVRHAVTREFKQTPGDIVLGFSLGNKPGGIQANLLDLEPQPRAGSSTL